MAKLNRPTWVYVDLKKLKKNLNYLRGLLPTEEFFCPMVKANAYGHGDIEICKTLQSEDVKAVGVALLDEGIHLRESGIQIQDILIFQPIADKKFVLKC